MINTYEGNKLIAQFMGAKIVERNGQDAIFMFKDAHSPEYFLNTNYNTYHSSWNWLMPVVEKINTIDSYAYNFVIRACNVRIDIPREGNLIVLETETTVDNQIKAVYEAVVKFIEWYNEKNK